MKSIGLALLFVVSGCASAPEPGGAEAFPAEPYAVVASESGSFSIEARTSPLQPPQRGLTDVELRIEDASGEPVDGLDVAVEPWMPDMGHGASTHPEVTAAGDGRYIASKVSLFMPGRWELRATLGGALNDRVVLSFKIP